MTFDSAPASDSSLFVQMGDDLVADLARSRYFKLLDDLLCPESADRPPLSCAHSFAGSIRVLRDLPVGLYDIGRILNFFRAESAQCDCQVLMKYACQGRFATICNAPPMHASNL